MNIFPVSIWGNILCFMLVSVGFYVFYLLLLLMIVRDEIAMLWKIIIGTPIFILELLCSLGILLYLANLIKIIFWG